MKISGIGPYGQCTKLERFSAAINYTERKNIVINREQLENAKDGLQCWKKILRKEKNEKDVERIEELSERKLSFDVISNIVDNEQMWIDLMIVLRE